MNRIEKESISKVITQLGIEDSIICLHSSLKSFGEPTVDPDIIIDAFLSCGCTLLVPTFNYDTDVPPPDGIRYVQNAYNYDHPVDPDKASIFDTHSTRLEKSMGAIPARILHHKESLRGNHPQNSFAAIGPKAKELINTQSALNVYGPYKKTYSQTRAFVILVGVDLTKATPIHYAEERAGRRLFRRWAKSIENSCVEVEVGSCSEGFEHFSSHLTEVEQRILVGSSQWRIFPFVPFIDIVSAAILENQSITQCDEPDCERCIDAIKGGPIL